MIKAMPCRHPLQNKQQIAGIMSCLLLACTPLAATASCSELPLSTIEVTLLETPTSMNFNYSYRKLRSLSEDHSRRDVETLGLTRGTATARFEIKGKTWQARNREAECATFDIRVIYGFSPITVHVGSEFPKGSCAHEEIYRHELEHVTTYQQHARAVREEITLALKKRFENTGPWYGGRGETSERLQRELNERWLPYIHRVLDQVKIAQRKIDSPEEYARIAGSCNGEIRDKLRKP